MSFTSIILGLSIESGLFGPIDSFSIQSYRQILKLNSTLEKWRLLHQVCTLPLSSLSGEHIVYKAYLYLNLSICIFVYFAVLFDGKANSWPISILDWYLSKFGGQLIRDQWLLSWLDELWQDHYICVLVFLPNLQFLRYPGLLLSGHHGVQRTI